METPLPISSNDIQLVLDSWNLVRGDITSIAVAVFLKMFDKHPDYHALFKKFSHIPITDLPNNEVFKDHAKIVLEAIDKVLLNLRNEDVVKNVLLQAGKIHSKEPVTEAHFTHCNEATISVLKTLLKEEFNNDVENAWDKVLTEATKWIVKGQKSNE